MAHSGKHRQFRRGGMFASALAILSAAPATAQDTNSGPTLQALVERLDRLEAENRELRARIEEGTLAPVRQPSMPMTLAEDGSASTPLSTSGDVVTERDDPAEMQVAGSENFIGTNTEYAYRMLDHAESITTKPLIQLAALRAGELEDRVTVAAGVTVLADWQKSSVDDKFAYLMRHPTGANQVGGTVSEAVVHAANLAVTGRLTDTITGYFEILYDPQQSFGPGTITALTRNQVQMRRAWVMFGNPDRTPFYALVGKMDTPFGLNDTVSPFTNSTNWHSFAGLAYGAQAGYLTDNLLVRAMAIQGGSQFRAANTSVNGTNVPSRLNNFAADARYTFSFPGDENALMIGGSWEKGSPYCQQYPVFHFNPCEENNPAIAAYGRLDYGSFRLIGEYAQTLKEWPGSAVPDPTNELSQYEAVKTRSFTAGARFGFGAENLSPQDREFAVSAEFSKFIAGDDGSPWERQNQSVLGFSWFPAASANLFAEYIHVDGFVPLNFLSGGNFPDGSTWSEQGVDTDVLLVGAQVAF